MTKNTRDIKEIIGGNITFLRKGKKWTQLELAEKMDYSDKAISKWERGESSPDPDALLALANLFDVQIDYFFHENEDEQKKFVKKSSKMFINGLLVTILLCISVFTISTVVFLIASLRDISNASTFWIAFIYAIPLCAIIVSIFLKRRDYRFAMSISLSILMWSILLVGFLQLLISNYYAWMIFLAGVPLEAAIMIYYFLKK